MQRRSNARAKLNCMRLEQVSYYRLSGILLTLGECEMDEGRFFKMRFGKILAFFSTF